MDDGGDDGGDDAAEHRPDEHLPGGPRTLHSVAQAATTQTHRRKAIYIDLHPETAHGGDRTTSRQLGDLKEPSGADRFTTETATSICIPRRCTVGIVDPSEWQILPLALSSMRQPIKPEKPNALVQLDAERGEKVCAEALDLV